MRFWMILATASLLTGCGDKDEDTTGFGGTVTDPGTTETETTDTDGGTSDTDGGTTTDTGDTGSTTDALDGAALYATHCASCHGAEGEGVQDVGPGLANEFNRHDDEFLVDVVLNGDGTMPPIAVSEEEAYAIVEWLRAFFEG